MELLEHPLEAVAFRLYYSLPEASAATGATAWTCLAAVLAAAAAAGLWRLRSPAAVGATKPLELKPTPAAEGLQPSRSSSSERCDPAAAEASTTAPSPKERYTAYFRDTGCIGFCDAGDDEEEEEADDEEEETDGNAEEREDEDARGGGAHYRRTTPETTTGPLGWEKAVVRTLPVPPLSPTAAADARGWRRRSPTAALGGCVVQLWDHQAAGGGGGGGLTPTTAASRRRRGRAVGGTVVAAAF
ncbi:hypothetical protein U9M48_029444 [Paspalum notatum var. saurae]|uniref:Uncharacterized protein n=1 Tax=Paspalum notatum var. saurae TaxID=547442 RepID=A0AAQ3U1I3_PASNO